MSEQGTLSVVLVTHYFPAHGGGIEIVAGQIAQRLVRDGECVIDWFSSDVDVAPEVHDVRVYPQRTFNLSERMLGVPFPLWTPAAYVRLARAVARCHVVHVHDGLYAANFMASLLAKAMGKRLVVTQHVGFVPYRNAMFRALLAIANRIVVHAVLRRADAVAFVSPTVQRYFERIAGPCGRYALVPNGVDTALFAPAAAGDADTAAADFPAANQHPLLLFVGRHVEKKGLDLIRELALRSPEWRWCLIGDGPIDPGRWNLPNVASVRRIPQRQLVAYYREATLLVLPSVGEGFPLVVQEALSCGLPVAVHTETRDAGGLPPSVCIAESVTDPKSVERWLERLRALLSESKEQREQRRVACRKLACERWSWEATSRRYAELLR